MDIGALLKENKSLQRANATKDSELALKNEELAKQSTTIAKQSAAIAELKRQLQWFKNQLFGARSEKRVKEVASPLQLSLFKDDLQTPELPPIETVTVREYERSNRKKGIEFSDAECRLQFDAKVRSNLS
jgi:transposase